MSVEVVVVCSLMAERLATIQAVVAHRLMRNLVLVRLPSSDLLRGNALDTVLLLLISRVPFPNGIIIK